MLVMPLALFVLLNLTNCSLCEREIYVDRVVKVNVPVRCSVPYVGCDFNRSTDTEVISGLLECIVNLKRANEVCK